MKLNQVKVKCGCCGAELCKGLTIPWGHTGKCWFCRNENFLPMHPDGCYVAYVENQESRR